MYVASRKATRILGIHANTLRKWADEGKISFIRSPSSGQRLYDVEAFLASSRVRKKICYCRVSSYKQRDDLERQVEFLKARFPEHEIIEDIGSGINFKRKGLLTILELINSGDVEQIVVAHGDRLTRFGFELIEWFARKHSTEILVLDNTKLSPGEEFTQDLLSIIHVFSRRLHGLRKYGQEISKDKNLPNSNTEAPAEESVGGKQGSIQSNNSPIGS